MSLSKITIIRRFQTVMLFVPYNIKENAAKGKITQLDDILTSNTRNILFRKVLFIYHKHIAKIQINFQFLLP